MYPRPQTRRRPLGVPALYSQSGAAYVREAFSPRMYAEGLMSLSGMSSAGGAVVGGAITAGGSAATTAIQGGDVTKNLVVSAPSIVGGVITAPGTGVISAAMWGGLAIPIIGAAVVGATIALTLLFNRKGPKQKRATTAIAEDVEPILEENLQGYLSGPRTRSSQQQAIQNFYAGWNYLVDQCGIPEMGTPGQNCINERKEGARPQWDACAPNCPNWFELYLDPIRNDTEVRPDPPVDQETLDIFGIDLPATGDFMEGTIGGFPLPLVAGLALVAFVLVSGGDSR